MMNNTMNLDNLSSADYASLRADYAADYAAGYEVGMNAAWNDTEISDARFLSIGDTPHNELSLADFVFVWGVEDGASDC